MEEIRFLTLSEIILIAQNQINLYGGMFGIRDTALLSSALVMPESTFGGELNRDVFTGMKLSGFENEFTFVGETTRGEAALKRQVTDRAMKIFLANKRFHHVGDGLSDIFIDRWCDPINIMNRILSESLYRDPYKEIESVIDINSSNPKATISGSWL